MGRRSGDIFEIFQNGHIFLKFLFFKKYKKEKTALRQSCSGIRGKEEKKTCSCSVGIILIDYFLRRIGSQFALLIETPRAYVNGFG